MYKNVIIKFQTRVKLESAAAQSSLFKRNGTVLGKALVSCNKFQLRGFAVATREHIPLEYRVILLHFLFLHFKKAP